MAGEQEQPVATEFAQWYGRLEVGQNAERRKARWSGLLAVCDETDRELVEALVRLAFDAGFPAAAASSDQIVACFRDADETFEAAPRELQILAACVLWRLLQDGDGFSSMAGLALQTASFCGMRRPELPMDLVGLADHAMAAMSGRVRKRPSLEAAATSYSMPPAFDMAIDKVAAEFNGPNVKAALDLVKSSYAGQSQRHAAADEALAATVRVQDEELQLLWWLTTGWSKLTGTSFESIPALAQPIVLAADLASMTKVLPGPQSLEGLLHRAGLKSRKQVGLGAVLKACNADWLRTLVAPGEPSPLTSPLHLAIRRFDEAQRSDKSIAGCEAAMRIVDGTTFSPMTLAVQFYRERLLMTLG